MTQLKLLVALTLLAAVHAYHPDPTRPHRCFELFEGKQVREAPKDHLKIIRFIQEPECRNECVRYEGCRAFTYWKPSRSCWLSRSTICETGTSNSVSGVFRTDCDQGRHTGKIVYIDNSFVYPARVVQPDNILTRVNQPEGIYTEVVQPARSAQSDNILTRVNRRDGIYTEVVEPSRVLVQPPVSTAVVLPGRRVITDGERRVYFPKIRNDAICVDRYQDFLNEGIEVLEKRSVSDEEECVTVCNEHSLCSAYSFFPSPSSSSRPSCWLHCAFTGEMAFEKGTISGSLRDCRVPYEPMLIHSSRNYKILPDFLGFGFSPKHSSGKYCWEQCRINSVCRAVSYSSRSNACFLESSAPTFNNPSDEMGAAIAIKLTGQFNFFPATNLGSGFYSESNTLEQRDMVFNVRDCEDLCLGRRDCKAYIHSLNEARCQLLGGYIDEMDLVGNQPNFAMGVRDGARLCWRKFLGHRSPAMSYFLRLLNDVPDAAACRMKCKENSRCKAFTFYKSYDSYGTCILKRRLESKMTLLDNTAVSAMLVSCSNRHVEMHAVEGFKFEYQPDVYKVTECSDFQACSGLCTADQSCAAYFFHPRTCYLMNTVPEGMFRADNAFFGVKLTGRFRAFKWRRFEITPGMNAVRVPNVDSGRACEEECLKRAYSAYAFNFQSLDCDLIPNPVREEDMVTDGFSIAGTLIPTPVMPAPERRYYSVREIIHN